ncbi:programmed cell death 1 ligand 1-like, partial [Clarias magur]
LNQPTVYGTIMDCGEELKDLEETHQPQGERANSTHSATVRFDPPTLQVHNQLIFIFWFIIGVGSVSAGSHVISARVGDTAILPCKASEVSTQTRVYWKTDSQVVFERWGGASFQGPGYEGRVDVPEDELRIGSCCLVVKNVSVTDAAVYTSYINSGPTHARKRTATTPWHLVQNVTLSVQEPSKVMNVR